MRILRASLAGCALAAWAWWATPASPIEGPQILRRNAPAPVDAVKLQLARWDRGDLGIFPKAEQGAPFGSGELRLRGTALSSARKAALISVGGAKPQWLAFDAPIAGLELVELTTGRAVVRTTSGDTVTLTVFHAPKPAMLEEADPRAAH